MAVLRPAGDFDQSYEQDMSILRKPWHVGITVVAILALYLAPLTNNAYIIFTLNRIAYTVIALQGLNILTGFTGQISLGQAAFMLVGGYASGLISTNLGAPLGLAIPLAALVTGGVGLLFGLPSLRVKGFYLAMATLAAQFIIPWLSRQPFLEDYLGGTKGFIEIPAAEIFGFSLSELSQFVYLSITVMLIMTVLSHNIGRTRLGRAFVAIRDNDLAAELLGVNLFNYKLRAFFIAAIFAGVAGALRAHSQRGVGTELGYTLVESVLFLGMLVIGGLGTNLGPFLGGIFVILVTDFSLWLGPQLAEIFPQNAAALQSSFRPIFFGMVLVLFLIFEPRGMAHRWTLMKAAWRLRPFAR